MPLRPGGVPLDVPQNVQEVALNSSRPIRRSQPPLKEPEAVLRNRVPYSALRASRPTYLVMALALIACGDGGSSLGVGPPVDSLPRGGHAHAAGRHHDAASNRHGSAA